MAKYPHVRRVAENVKRQPEFRLAGMVYRKSSLEGSRGRKAIDLLGIRNDDRHQCASVYRSPSLDLGSESARAFFRATPPHGRDHSLPYNWLRIPPSGVRAVARAIRARWLVLLDK